MIRAVYPGTFDPIHNGHIDIATRASLLFDELVFAVYDTPPKKLLFDTQERVELAHQALGHLGNVSVISFRGLTVQCALDQRARVIVRGLRNLADFEFEYQVGLANNHLAPEVELCCLICGPQYAFLSATIVKEVASLGGDVRDWVPAGVHQSLQGKFTQLQDQEPANSFTKAQGKLAHRG
jgi:pantetheine-phosphate adenylyltransferase